MDNIRQERSWEGTILNLNERLQKNSLNTIFRISVKEFMIKNYFQKITV